MNYKAENDDCTLEFQVAEFRVLIVERDFKSSDSLRSCLANLSPVVKIASINSVEAARHYLEDDKFHIIFVDINIDKSKGIKSIEDVRKYAGDTPIIAITGQIEDITVDEFNEAGASILLPKEAISPKVVQKTLDALGVIY